MNWIVLLILWLEDGNFVQVLVDISYAELKRGLSNKLDADTELQTDKHTLLIGRSLLLCEECPIIRCHRLCTSV
jgi:hypothetical protein